MSHSHKRSTCRLCASSHLQLAIHLKPIPAADGYVAQAQKDLPQELFPLDLYLCGECGHAQLLDVVDPAVLFRDYIYVTSSSLGLIAHFRAYAESILAGYSFAISGSKKMLEVGSNEGIFMNFFKEKGFTVLGVDPARQIAEKATRAGLETWPEFFNFEIAKKIKNEKGLFEIVAANNVFAHSDDLSGMADGVRHLLQKDGIFIFEVNYLGDLLEKGLFDIIYHEHISIHSAKPLKTFLEKHGLELIDVKRVASKAGSLRCVAQPSGGPRKVAPSVADILAYEKKGQMDDLRPFNNLQKKMETLREQLRALVTDIKGRGQSIAAYGAAPASTTLIYFFELENIIEFIADDNPIKQGRFSPGCHVPVLPSENLLKRKPDYVIVLAWTYLEPILERNQAYRKQGGKFIVPLPDVKVL